MTTEIVIEITVKYGLTMRKFSLDQEDAHMFFVHPILTECQLINQKPQVLNRSYWVASSTVSRIFRSVDYLPEFMVPVGLKVKESIYDRYKLN